MKEPKKMKCCNKAQTVQRTCNDVDFEICEDCPSLCSSDWVGGWYIRCNNKVPIKFGEIIQPPGRGYPQVHRRKDKYAQHENRLRRITYEDKDAAINSILFS